MQVNKNKIIMKRRLGISPVLATVMIFGLILAGVMLTFIQVIPYIEKAQSEENISSVRNSFLDLDMTILYRQVVWKKLPEMMILAAE